MAHDKKGEKEQAGKTLAMAILSYDWSAEKATMHDAEFGADEKVFIRVVRLLHKTHDRSPTTPG